MLPAESLLEIFVNRPRRYRLLDKGWNDWMASSDAISTEPILEIGCAYGDASAYLADTYGLVAFGLDQNPIGIEEAGRRHRELVFAKKLHFIHGDAAALPFPAEHFAGVIMEASFSPLTDKTSSVNEIFRVIQHGGRVLLNDFAVREPVAKSKNRRSNIPCLKGVDSMEGYRKRFEAAGFTAAHMKEEHGELIHMALWLSKCLGISLSDVNTESGQKLTYCQMIFEKE